MLLSVLVAMVLRVSSLAETMVVESRDHLLVLHVFAVILRVVLLDLTLYIGVSPVSVSVAKRRIHNLFTRGGLGHLGLGINVVHVHSLLAEGSVVRIVRLLQYLGVQLVLLHFVSVDLTGVHWFLISVLAVPAGVGGHVQALGVHAVLLRALFPQIFVLVGQHARLQIDCLSELAVVESVILFLRLGSLTVVLLLSGPEILLERLVLRIAVQLSHLPVVSSGLFKGRRPSSFFLANGASESLLLLLPYILRCFFSVESGVAGTGLGEDFSVDCLLDGVSEDITLPPVSLVSDRFVLLLIV
mmetsp:Transcript_14535/g.22577  ORF Transcript_14535/g.22577 Transcript_14535/m.22577 type:complete len:300 (-) Transcript_14535:384-1283(-)